MNDNINTTFKGNERKSAIFFQHFSDYWNFWGLFGFNQAEWTVYDWGITQSALCGRLWPKFDENGANDGPADMQIHLNIGWKFANILNLFGRQMVERVFICINALFVSVLGDIKTFKWGEKRWNEGMDSGDSNHYTLWKRKIFEVVWENWPKTLTDRVLIWENWLIGMPAFAGPSKI